LEIARGGMKKVYDQSAKTHPDIVALVTPLFACGGKRVKNEFVMLNAVKCLLSDMYVVE
jgi:hypothetical protein